MPWLALLEVLVDDIIARTSIWFCNLFCCNCKLDDFSSGNAHFILKDDFVSPRLWSVPTSSLGETKALTIQ